MIGKRKLAVAVLGILVGAGLAYAGKLDSASAGLIGGIVTAFLTANVTQKAVTQ